MGPLGGLGITEIILIFLVILLLFGAKRIPEIGSALGKGIREFKGSLREIEDEIKRPEQPKTPPPSSQPREVASPRGAPEEASSPEGGEAPPAESGEAPPAQAREPGATGE